MKRNYLTLRLLPCTEGLDCAGVWAEILQHSYGRLQVRY